MLYVHNVFVFYDGIKAVDGVSLEIHQEEIVALIGSNGAGKSTLLRAIMGLVPKSGEVSLSGQDISNERTTRIIERGVSLVPETRDLFPRMSVQENLRLGAFLEKDEDKIRQSMESVFDLFPVLHERRQQRAGTLSGGEQQMLALGRALMQHPHLLLLDEPSLGLAPKLTDELFERIRQINQDGTAVLLVEQKGKLALEIASRGYALQVGKIVRQGTSEELSADELVRRIYFGD